MTITTISFRDLQRGVMPTDGIVHLVDKKSGKSKGLFIPPIFENEILELLENSEKSKKQKKLQRLKSFAGKNIIDDKYDNLSTSEIKKQIVLEKFGG
jgi:hypothetical protein